MFARPTDFCLTLTRGIALWSALIASSPRVGCLCADGTRLPFCAATVANLFGAKSPAADEAVRCDSACPCCRETGEKASSACPVSGQPCEAMLSSASPSTLVDMVDAPSPILGETVRLTLCADDREISTRAETATDHVPRIASDLVTLGQLLRV